MKLVRWGTLAVLVVGLGACTSKQSNSAVTTTSPPSTAPPTTGAPSTAAPTTIPTRQVTGAPAVLGAGTFSGGKDVKAGLYDVTAGAGQSGNFVVQGTDSYNEILGSGTGGVAKVRVKISDGDTIQISSLSQVAFTPVTTPLVTTHSQVMLYAGTWTVGEDLGPGRYTATPGSGQSGNFVVEAEGVNEILGGTTGGVPSVSVNVKNGDVITIGSLSQVTMTPA